MPGLVDRVFAFQEAKGSSPTGGTCLNNFFDPIDHDICTKVCSELENSGINVAVGDCSVTERCWWHQPYQTGKTVYVHTKTLQTQQGGTHDAGCARARFCTAEPLGGTSL